eukprot:COSAG04_NODE_554_length_12674_cov_89.442068_4_plen_1025_part_00
MEAQGASCSDQATGGFQLGASDWLNDKDEAEEEQAAAGEASGDDIEDAERDLAASWAQEPSAALLPAADADALDAATENADPPQPPLPPPAAQPPVAQATEGVVDLTATTDEEEEDDDQQDDEDAQEEEDDDEEAGGGDDPDVVVVEEEPRPAAPAAAAVAVPIQRGAAAAATPAHPLRFPSQWSSLPPSARDVGRDEGELDDLPPQIVELRQPAAPSPVASPPDPWGWRQERVTHSRSGGLGADSNLPGALLGALLGEPGPKESPGGAQALPEAAAQEWRSIAAPFAQIGTVTRIQRCESVEMWETFQAEKKRMVRSLSKRGGGRKNLLQRTVLKLEARNDFAWGSADVEPRKWQLCTLEIYVEQGRGGRAGQRMMMLACEDSSVTTAPLSGCVVEAVGDGSGEHGDACTVRLAALDSSGRMEHTLRARADDAEDDVDREQRTETLGQTLERLSREAGGGAADGWKQGPGCWRVGEDRSATAVSAPPCHERRLFHTSRTPAEVICEEGFDPRLANQSGRFGKGVYFSDDVTKCNHYWRSGNESDEGERYMFVCQVLLGESKVYPPLTADPGLLREPDRDTDLRQHPLMPGDHSVASKGRWDSVHGKADGQYNEYIIYEGRRAYPQYVVWYKPTHRAARRPVLPRTSGYGAPRRWSSHAHLGAQPPPGLPMYPPTGARQTTVPCKVCGLLNYPSRLDHAGQCNVGHCQLMTGMFSLTTDTAICRHGDVGHTDTTPLKMSYMEACLHVQATPGIVGFTFQQRPTAGRFTPQQDATKPIEKVPVWFKDKGKNASERVRMPGWCTYIFDPTARPGPAPPAPAPSMAPGPPPNLAVPAPIQPRPVQPRPSAQPTLSAHRFQSARPPAAPAETDLQRALRESATEFFVKQTGASSAEAKPYIDAHPADAQAAVAVWRSEQAKAAPQRLEAWRSKQPPPPARREAPEQGAAAAAGPAAKKAKTGQADAAADISLSHVPVFKGDRMAGVIEQVLNEKETGARTSGNSARSQAEEGEKPAKRPKANPFLKRL